MLPIMPIMPTRGIGIGKYMSLNTDLIPSNLKWDPATSQLAPSDGASKMPAIWQYFTNPTSKTATWSQKSTMKLLSPN